MQPSWGLKSESTARNDIIDVPASQLVEATTSSVKLIPQERAKNLEVEQIMDLIDVFVIRQGQVPATNGEGDHRSCEARSTCRRVSSRGRCRKQLRRQCIWRHMPGIQLLGGNPARTMLFSPCKLASCKYRPHGKPTQVQPIITAQAGKHQSCAFPKIVVPLHAALAATSCKRLPHVKRRCLHARTLSAADTSMQTHSANLCTDTCV